MRYSAGVHWRRLAKLASLLAGMAIAAPASAEQIRVGILKVGSSGPVYIAQERGYFASEGLTTELVNFEAGQAVSVAVLSGDLDIGVTGLTASLYNMAARGEVRVLAGLHREARGFHLLGYFVSKRAYAIGVTSFKDFPGHSVAITTIGSTTHYALGLLADKYGYPLQELRVLPLQTISNSAAAVIGGQADIGLIPGTLTQQMLNQGEAHLIGWVGDETPWQIGSVFVATKTADERKDMLMRFLRALRKGAREYHDAFTGPGEVRQDGPTAPAVLAIAAKYLGETPEKLEVELPYVDPDMRLDARDVSHQIAWYKAQGMVKGDITAEKLIDARYSVLPP
jgi:NitT/TauT family transport system substrate-binding protein